MTRLHAQVQQPPAPGFDAQAIGNPCCGIITPQGRRMIALLDSMDVEHHWLPHERVHWQTGDRDTGPRKRSENYTSHCSGFVAAVSARVHVYLLRPPEHGQTLLANAQGRWLRGDRGVREGWQAVSAEEAQARANRGDFVIVNYMNPDPHSPGHIAVIRPSEKTAAELAQYGPEITQAGGHNYNDAVVAGHFKRWNDGGIRYYAHAVDWSRVNGAIDPQDLDDSPDSEKP
jgi:hypothetical protein